MQDRCAGRNYPLPIGKGGGGGIGRAMSRQQVTPYGTNYE